MTRRPWSQIDAIHPRHAGLSCLTQQYSVWFASRRNSGEPEEVARGDVSERDELADRIHGIRRSTNSTSRPLARLRLQPLFFSRLHPFDVVIHAAKSSSLALHQCHRSHAPNDPC